MSFFNSRVVAFVAVAGLLAIPMALPQRSKAADGKRKPSPTEKEGQSTGSLQTSAFDQAESLYWTGGKSLEVPKTVDVLRVKAPYLSFPNGIIVVRVTDAEWATLVKEYPANQQNGAATADIVFTKPAPSE